MNSFIIHDSFIRSLVQEATIVTSNTIFSALTMMKRCYRNETSIHYSSCWWHIRSPLVDRIPALWMKWSQATHGWSLLRRAWQESMLPSCGFHSNRLLSIVWLVILLCLIICAPSYPNQLTKFIDTSKIAQVVNNLSFGWNHGSFSSPSIKPSRTTSLSSHLEHFNK